MQPDILPTLEPGLYPAQSRHQEDIEKYFGPSLLRKLSEQETRSLGGLDIFFVLFTNRCGSTFLTEIMNQVGFGIPPKAEVFNSDLLIDCCEEHKITSFTDYFLQVAQGWQVDSQVGFKIGAHQLFWLTKTGLLSHFRKIKIVHSHRRDTVGQAVSLYIAMQTGQWHSLMNNSEVSRRLPYSRDEILRCLQSIHDGKKLMRYYTDIHNLPCLRVDYEDTMETPDREVSRIADFLDIPRSRANPVELSAISIQQQRDENNKRLCDLFQNDFFRHTDAD